MLGGGVATRLGSELTLLQVDVGRHALAGVTVGQVEHRVVQGVEAGQGDELELEAHGTQFLLELGDGRVVQVLLPVEGRAAVVGQQLVREVGLDGLGELASDLEVRHTGLHPDEVGVRSVCLGARDTGLDALLHVVEALGGALTGDERLVTLIHIGGDEGGGLGIGAGDDDGRGVGDVGGQASRGQRADVLLGGNQHLATEVAALLLRGQLVLPVGTGGTRGDHGLLQFVDVQRATEAGLTVGDDRHEPVVDAGVALDAGDLVGPQQGVVDAANHGRHRVGRVQALVRVGVAGKVGVTGDLPTGQVDGLKAGADLLNGHVAGQGTQRVDVRVVVLGDGVPQDLGATAGKGVLLDDAALQLLNLGGGVVAGDALPAGVGVPVLLDFGRGARLADIRHWYSSVTCPDVWLSDFLPRTDC
ncbi:Uncharacterised protein [Mycobacteroides abscessus subsp. massiliense]|nr:Uncharacterised protein [Mycobacteroides abscessus subsp. massiliense]